MNIAGSFGTSLSSLMYGTLGSGQSARTELSSATDSESSDSLVLSEFQSASAGSSGTTTSRSTLSVNDTEEVFAALDGDDNGTVSQAGVAGASTADSTATGGSRALGASGAPPAGGGAPPPGGGTEETSSSDESYSNLPQEADTDDDGVISLQEMIAYYQSMSSGDSTSSNGTSGESAATAATTDSSATARGDEAALSRRATQVTQAYGLSASGSGVFGQMSFSV